MDFQKIIGKLKELDQPKAAPTVIAESTVMEKKLTKGETKKKEEVVKSMKKSKGDFEKRYGKDKGEQVMYATATKIAKKKAESIEALDSEEEIAEVFDADAKVGDKKKTAKGVATKTATGLKHERTYKDEKEEETPAKKSKKANEGFDADAKPGDKFSTKTGVATKTKTGVKHERTKYDDSDAKKDDKKKVKEAAKPDFLDVDKDGDKKEPMKKAVADKKKKPVKESVEPKLSFKECIRLVRESGGQQQIDPVDKVLWQWAQRVAQSKFTESIKQDAFAGITYERFGGRFALHDVLSETKE